jgi:hypothetical protein
MNPILAQQMAMTASYGVQQPVGGAGGWNGSSAEPPALSPLQQRIEMDRYDEDKKAVGVDEAAKRAEDRERKRAEEWKTKQGLASAAAAEAAKPRNP